METWTPTQTYESILPHLNEKQRRLYVGSEALRRGYGGVSSVSQESGISRVTITRGIQELKEGIYDNKRIRMLGGGRKKLQFHQKNIGEVIKKIAHPKGDPMAPLLHTSLSMEHIAKEAQRQGYHAGRMSVWRILKDAGFALQANKKEIEGSKRHPDRNAQFEHINNIVADFQQKKCPVLSADCKKKELLGNFKNGGREWQEQGGSTEVNVYDFESLANGKAIPYGVYDLVHKKGFVNVGIDHDTAEFAVESLRRWWGQRGKQMYTGARELLVLVDGGGSNGSRLKLWKKELQDLANEVDMAIHVCHYPPYTSKWNAIEHELFSFISINWRAKPLISLEVVLELISHTKTEKGLEVTAVKDGNMYPKGIKVPDEEMSRLNIIRDKFHGDWNYVIKPQINM